MPKPPTIKTHLQLNQLERLRSRYISAFLLFTIPTPTHNTNLTHHRTRPKYLYLNYQSYRDYGIPTGTYRLYLYMRGYLHAETDLVYISSGSLLRTSSNLHRGARLNMTVYSVDREHPRIQRPWKFPGARLRIYILNKDTQKSAGYIGYSSLPGGDNEPNMQPTCHTRSSILRFCTTGSPQVIDLNGPPGSTIMINEWDGYIQADADGAGISPTVVQFGASYFPPWNIGGFLESPSDYRLDASSKFAPNDALPTGLYSSYAFTYGYVQTATYTAFLMEGGVRSRYLIRSWSLSTSFSFLSHISSSNSEISLLINRL